MKRISRGGRADASIKVRRFSSVRTAHVAPPAVSFGGATCDAWKISFISSEELIVYGDADALLAAAHAEYAAEIDPVFKRVFGDLKLEPLYDLA